MKFKIYKFKTVTSTNDEAINFIKKSKKKCGYIYAEHQTNGRGTYGKKWVSNKGNLFGTIFFQLKNNYPPFNEFSIINALLVSDVIKFFCNKKKVSLKFPNDIFISSKKICGILQELITVNEKNFLIIGIGINTVSNPLIKESYKATNILFETQKEPKIVDIINLLISSYEKFFQELSLYNYTNYKKKAELMAI